MRFFSFSFFLLKFLDAQVTFTNDEQEYQFYEIEYEVTEPEVIESIKLTTTVRSEICYPLKFENPLEYIIKLKANCLNPFITVKVPRLMPPQSYVSNRCPVFYIVQTILTGTCIKFLGVYLHLFSSSAAMRRVCHCGHLFHLYGPVPVRIAIERCSSAP